MDIFELIVNNPLIYEYSIDIFEIKKHKKPETDEHEKDARLKIIAIRLINSSSTSVSNSNMKKHMITKSLGICGLSKDR